MNLLAQMLLTPIAPVQYTRKSDEPHKYGHLQQDVLDYLSTCEEPVTPREIREELGRTKGVIYDALIRLEAADTIECVRRVPARSKVASLWRIKKSGL